MTERTHTDQPAAVALGYDPHAGDAPKVLASGYGHIAKRILDIAREEQIHIHQDDTLAKLLARVPSGTEIPEQAYQLVAELLSFLYQTDRKLAEKMTTYQR
ncbi:MAG: EscU/YscU/HrcU family type III secretion system export apparatus switch protein [Mariprofundaceae bacterium]